MPPAFDLRTIRNIGIIAHIDAGKTTTSERILFYSGQRHKCGDVDAGTTVTDFLPEEQERGITIRAAAITCQWKNITINIIDTPGHVDFTAEVERSLRVLDGGVVIFSGVEGVEAQSETVWRQADHYHVPRLCFINKLDRIGADFFRVLDEIGERLEARTIPMQIPIGREKEFRGCIDLLRMKAYFFDEKSQGKEVIEAEIPEEHLDEATAWRDKMIEGLADADDAVADAYLNGETIPNEKLAEACRAACIKHRMTPVFCGSSLKYIGVQPLLDAVAAYLPSPLDVPDVVGEHPESGKEDKRPPKADLPFCGLLFKITADQHEELGFVRVYSGQLKPASRVLNPRNQKKENITRLVRIQGDKLEKVDIVYPGDIVGVIGLRNSVTGDTLCDPKSPILLEKITFPPTVVSMSIEPESSADKDKLVQMLEVMQKEDPTFRAQVSAETGETLISGMGELHLEVISDRLKREYKLNIRVGKPRVSYRETIRNHARSIGECQRQLANGSIYGKVEIDLAPIAKTADGGGKTRFQFVNQCANPNVPREMQLIIQDALQEECQAGGRYGYPLTDIQATLIDADFRPGESNEQAYRFAVSQAVHKALESADVNILEPIMKLEVVTPEEYLGEVTADLGARGAIIENVAMRGNLRVVQARTPLRRMFGYTTTLRSISQGRASSSMEPLDYEAAPPEFAKQLLA